MSAQAGSFVVAIDGPAGAGKSTVAKTLARRLGYTFLDSGALYRAGAWAARRRGIAWSDGRGLGQFIHDLDIRFDGRDDANRITVDGEDVTEEIRRPEISEGASQVSAFNEVRAGLLALQRRIGASGRVVAEGRDMGTVVFPDARAKFFLTAPIEERARRRAAELAASGRPQDFDVVLAEMRLRDQRDSTRAIAPLRRAEDAIEIDTASLTPEEVVGRMAALVRERGG
ncbi:MAG: (d)CMP kinase [Polyangia bacterium]|jgi:cytidylate kinase